MSATRHAERARALMRLPANRKVVGAIEGGYVALHPGRSTEFADVREYVHGDDPKDIDWKASARARSLYVRRHHAHRKLTALLVVSTGRSMAARAAAGTKRDLAIDVAGTIGAVATAHGDLVSLVYGDDESHRYVRPRGGRGHLDRCLDAVHAACSAAAGRSDLAGLLHEIERSARRRGLVVLVVDEVELTDEARRRLAGLRGRHELLVVVVDGADPFDVDLDSSAVADIDDDVPLPAWLRHDAELARQHRALVVDDAAELSRELDRLGIAHVHVGGEQDVLPALARLFDRHRRAGGR